MDQAEGDSGARGERVASQIEDAAAEIGALVREHPVGALAAALGLGYALGGGLFTRTTSRLVGTALRLGVRFALLPVLERELAGLAAAGRSLHGEADEGEDERTHH